METPNPLDDKITKSSDLYKILQMIKITGRRVLLTSSEAKSKIKHLRSDFSKVELPSDSMAGGHLQSGLCNCQSLILKLLGCHGNINALGETQGTSLELLQLLSNQSEHLHVLSLLGGLD